LSQRVMQLSIAQGRGQTEGESNKRSADKANMRNEVGEYIGHGVIEFLVKSAA